MHGFILGKHVARLCGAAGLILAVAAGTSASAAPHFVAGTASVGSTTYYVKPPLDAVLGFNLEMRPVVTASKITREGPGCSEGYWYAADGKEVFGSACLDRAGRWRLAAE